VNVNVVVSWSNILVLSSKQKPLYVVLMKLVQYFHLNTQVYKKEYFTELVIFILVIKVCYNTSGFSQKNHTTLSVAFLSELFLPRKN
jgi:hypothetical protein